VQVHAWLPAQASQNAVLGPIPHAKDLGNEPIMTRNSNSDRSPTCCSSGLKSISRKESEDALTLDGKTIKVATEQFTAITDPDHTQRAVTREEEQSMISAVSA
jgi:hypothetical protein